MKLQQRSSLAALFLFAITVARSSGTKTSKIVIDADAGGDDAIAILLTLQTESLYNHKLLAVTCTYGNTDEHYVEDNVRKTLTIANRSDIPIYAGAQGPFTNVRTQDRFFGKDGFGDFDFGREITAKVDKSKHAAVALIDLVKQHPKQITLLALGPLTNIALAVSMFPEFLNYVGHLIVLGASVNGIGGISPGAEFNFFQDPESNYIVLNNTQSLITLIPWETITGMHIPTTWRIYELGKLDSPIIEFLNKAERLSLQSATQWNSGDSLAATLMIWPEIIEKSTVTNVHPIIDGAAKGTVIVDYTNLSDRQPNAFIVQKVNTSQYQQKLISWLG